MISWTKKVTPIWRRIFMVFYTSGAKWRRAFGGLAPFGAKWRHLVAVIGDFSGDRVGARLKK